MFKKIIQSKILAYIIFYGWNLCFLVLAVAVESTERFFSEILWYFFQDGMPISYLLCTAIMLLLPLGSLVMGFTTFLHKPKSLLRWFYGVEVPILILILFRTFAFNQLPTQSAFWFVLVAISIVAYAASLLIKSFKNNSLNLTCIALQLYVGLVILTLLVLLFIPLGALFFTALFTEKWWVGFDLTFLLEGGLLLLLFCLFMVLSGTLFAIAPIAYFRFYVIENIQLLRKNLISATAIVYFTFGVILFVAVAFPYQQSQIKAFDLSEKWAEGEVDNETFLSEETAVKSGLLNAYLLCSRYPLKTSDKLLEELYKSAFNTDSTNADNIAQFVLHPFVYQGDWKDKEKADTYYENIFDVATERAEMQTIVDAKSATSSPWRVRDDILTVKEEQVLVTNREVTTKETSPGWVQIQMHERYINKTKANQEVFYYFSLPPKTVLTGMWLSDEDDNPTKFKYAVAPRGAAQQLYQQEKRARRDPSLLEQVGPFQYRLRVFPVPRKPWVSFKNRNKKPEETLPMHLTIQLLTQTDENGTIALPTLNEKRNVYWNKKEVGLDKADWFTAKTTGYTPSKPSNTYAFVDIIAQQNKLSTLPKQKIEGKITVLIDGSYSMGKQLDGLKKSIKIWEYRTQAEFYLAKGKRAIKIENIEALNQNQFLGLNFDLPILKAVSQKLPNNRLLYITDKGSYELLNDTADYKRFESDKPIDVIHLNGWAPIYEDAFMESVLRSGGGFYNSLANWKTAAETPIDSGVKHFIEGENLYTFAKRDNFFDSDSIQEVNPLFAHHYAMALSKAAKQLDTNTLDQLHQFAVEHHFVSPYSSMICLVNTRQQEELEKLSGKGDRFKRETETGNDSLGIMNVKGTPEPHEWVLIICALSFLLFLYRKRWIPMLTNFYSQKY